MKLMTIFALVILATMAYGCENADDCPVGNCCFQKLWSNAAICAPLKKEGEYCTSIWQGCPCGPGEHLFAEYSRLRDIFNAHFFQRIDVCIGQHRQNLPKVGFIERKPFRKTQDLESSVTILY